MEWNPEPPETKMPYEPKDLYHRIVSLRRSEGLDAGDAAERVAEELQPDATEVWRDLGGWFMRRLEQEMQRSYGFRYGGQSHGDTHGLSAPASDPNIQPEGGGQQRRDTQGTLAAPSGADQEESGGQRRCDTQSSTAPLSSTDNGRGHRSRDTQRSAAAPTPETTEAGGHGTGDTHPATAPRTPWPLRHRNIDLNMELRIPQRGAKPLGDTTGADWLYGGRVYVRSGKTLVKRGKAMLAIGNAMKPDETLSEALARNQSAALAGKVKRMLQAG